MGYGNSRFQQVARAGRCVRRVEYLCVIVGLAIGGAYGAIFRSIIEPGACIENAEVFLLIDLQYKSGIIRFNGNGLRISPRESAASIMAMVIYLKYILLN